MRKRRRTSWQRQTACDLPFINTQRWAALCHSVQSSIHTRWQGVTHTMLHNVWQMQICGSKKLIQSSTLQSSQQRQPSRVCVCVITTAEHAGLLDWLSAGTSSSSTHPTVFPQVSQLQECHKYFHAIFHSVTANWHGFSSQPWRISLPPFVSLRQVFWELSLHN